MLKLAFGMRMSRGTRSQTKQGSPGGVSFKERVAEPPVREGRRHLADNGAARTLRDILQSQILARLIPGVCMKTICRWVRPARLYADGGISSAGVRSLRQITSGKSAAPVAGRSRDVSASSSAPRAAHSAHVHTKYPRKLLSKSSPLLSATGATFPHFRCFRQSTFNTQPHPCFSS
jgi:hypothetical protein